MKKFSQHLISKIASKKAVKQNVEALRLYGFYKEASDLIDRVDIALGRKQTFKVITGSTLNSEISNYGDSSTTSQKV